jgi:hypothetical protein
VDLARVFVDGLTSPMRRVHQEALTRRYADALAARGVTDYGVERVRSDLSAVFTICFASMVRWAGGPDPLPDVPRVPVVVDVIMRQTADAFAESAR